MHVPVTKQNNKSQTYQNYQKSTSKKSQDVYQYCVSEFSSGKLIILGRCEKIYLSLPYYSNFLSDGCKTIESGSFLNTFSKIWLIWKSCEYDKKELCLQKILTLSILMFSSFKGEKYSKRNPRKFQGGYVCTKRARAKIFNGL